MYLIAFLVAALVSLADGQTFRSETATGEIVCGSGTGLTCTDYGGLAKVTVLSTNVTSNALTHDVTLLTLPAKAKVLGVVADLTTTFACTATCTTATLSWTMGKTAGGTEYLLSLDADAAAARFGLSVATTGVSLVANAVQGGDVPSWTATTALNARMTSAVGNLATGGVTNLSQGSITFYVKYAVFP